MFWWFPKFKHFWLSKTVSLQWTEIKSKINSIHIYNGLKEMQKKIMFMNWNHLFRPSFVFDIKSNTTKYIKCEFKRAPPSMLQNSRKNWKALDKNNCSYEVNKSIAPVVLSPGGWQGPCPSADPCSFPGGTASTDKYPPGLLVSFPESILHIYNGAIDGHCGGSRWLMSQDELLQASNYLEVWNG